MLTSLAISFLVGSILGGINFTDFYFLSFITLIYIFIIFFIRNSYKTELNFLKDMSFMSFIMSFIIFIPLTFYFGIYWSTVHSKPVSYLKFTTNNVQITGVVTDREMRSDKQLLTVRLGEVHNLDLNKGLSLEGEEVMIPVSMFQEFELYEKLQIKAKTEPENWREVSEQRPLMYRYETDSFLEERAFSVSPYGLKIEKLEYEPTSLEKIFKVLKELKMSFIKVLQKYLSEPYASLASGITFGENGMLSRETQNAMRQSGLVHMMVLSGANISFIIGMIWILTRRLGVQLRVVSVLTVAWVFIVMTGMSAPALRAGAMATLAILAESTGRPQYVLRGLLLALGLETLLDPEALLRSASLHLSFLTCFGLFVVAPVIANFLLNKNFLKSKILANMFALIIGVWISNSIYILGMSGSVNILGGILTLIAEPVIALSTVLTFLTIILNYFASILAQIISFFNTFLLQIFLFLAEFGANTLSQITISLSRSFVILYYLIFITIFLIAFRKIESSRQVKFLEESILLRK